MARSLIEAEGDLYGRLPCLVPVTIRVRSGGTKVPDVPAWNRDASLTGLTILNQVIPSIALAVPIDPEMWMLGDNQV